MTACATPGDFCDVAEPLVFNDTAAQAVAQADPDTGRKVVAQNLYGIETCPAGWWGVNP